MSIWENQVLRLVGNKAKRRISKRVFQENKARQIFRKRKRGKKCFFFFQKIWRALFSWNTRCEIRPSALLPTNFSCGHHWSKTFLTNTTAMDSQEISKIQSKLLVKPKTIQSLSGCKNHAINLLNSSNLFWDTPDFRIPWSKKSCPFWA